MVSRYHPAMDKPRFIVTDQCPFTDVLHELIELLNVPFLHVKCITKLSNIWVDPAARQALGTWEWVKPPVKPRERAVATCQTPRGDSRSFAKCVFKRVPIRLASNLSLVAKHCWVRIIRQWSQSRTKNPQLWSTTILAAFAFCQVRWKPAMMRYVSLHLVTSKQRQPPNSQPSK